MLFDYDELKPLMVLFSIILLSYPVWLVVRVFYRYLKRKLTREFREAVEEAGYEDVESLPLPRSIKVRSVICATITALFIFLFGTLLLEPVLSGLMTAHVVVLQPDNDAQVKQVFIWDGDYPEVGSAGNYVINRTDDKMVVWEIPDKVAKSRKAVSLARDAKILKVAPGEAVKVVKLPRNYCGSDTYWSVNVGQSTIMPQALFDSIRNETFLLIERHYTY